MIRYLEIKLRIIDQYEIAGALVYENRSYLRPCLHGSKRKNIRINN